MYICEFEIISQTCGRSQEDKRMEENGNYTIREARTQAKCQVNEIGVAPRE